MTEIELTASARRVLEKRYLWRNDFGKPVETPEQMLRRVANAIASPENSGGARGKAKAEAWAEKFYELMASRRFMPNTPTLMNAGRPLGQLSACYVLPVEDSLDGIFDTLKYAAKIHQSGGGTGFSFSALRPKGERVGSTRGIASGPVSFMLIYDSATEIIKQGGARRGANMAVLRVDHPDIFEFIDLKRDKKSLLNFNVSIGATDEFMEAVEDDGRIDLKDPRDGRVVRSVRAREIFDQVAESAWECGDPGLVFLGRINQFNPTPREGEMESTNPCGEQPLLPYESCNLGSLNVGLYATAGGVDWAKLEHDVDTAVRFLDNVITANHYPVRECEKITLRNRKIGLGVMGFADLLLYLGIPYASDEALALGERVMSTIDRRAKAASARLAVERGAFLNFRGSLWERLGYPKLRNATTTTVAPTGTISIIAGASSGIEPIYAAQLARNVLEGERLEEWHPAVERELKRKGADPARLARLGEAEIGRVLGPAWSPAHAVPVEAHVKMQAVFQRFSDSAVSKTVNLPNSATIDQVRDAYLLAYRSGCKGITVYRDRSRPTQVLDAVREPAQDIEYCPQC